MLQRLLKQMQVDLGQVAMTAHSGVAARDALLRHEVDAVFMVAAPSAPGIGALLSARGVHLASLRRTAAISERNNYLENRLLPEDTLGAGQPPGDTPVLTTPTHLLVRQDLDPALKRLAAAVAMEVHGGAGYMRDSAVERFYRDVRVFRIYEGTTQIQQLIIGKELARRFREGELG